MAASERRPGGFDGAAAVTRSLLGYGVLAGVVYLVAGLLLATTREGFEPTRHPLSLLMLGEGGWMQRTNLIVAGLMTITAAVGFARALHGTSAAQRVPPLVGVYGLALVLSGTFPPDPMAGFPPGASATDDVSLSGVLHLGAGAAGFLALAAAAWLSTGWLRANRRARAAAGSRAGAVVVLVGFLGGAALATAPAGVGLLWLAVVAGWAWLAGASLLLYRSVPHPDPERRAVPGEAPGAVDDG